MGKEEELSNAEKALVDNAFLFLQESTENIEKPIIGITQLSTAVELLLKARLMREHWTLLVEDKPIPSLDKFLNGNFKSIRASLIIDLLEKVIDYKFSDDAKEELGGLFKEKNSTVHWYRPIYDNVGEQIRLAQHQCRAWHYLKDFLEKEFIKKYEDLNVRIRESEKSMQKSKLYLEDKFNRLVRKKALNPLFAYSTCEACGYQAFREVAPNRTSGLCSVNCQVCGFLTEFFKIKCLNSDCKADIFIEVAAGHNQHTCLSCDTTHQELEKISNGEYMDAQCKRCVDGSCVNGSIVGRDDLGYMCLECFLDNSELDWCKQCKQGLLIAMELDHGENYFCDCCQKLLSHLEDGRGED